MLDIENRQSFTLAYWGGWYQAVANADFNGALAFQPGVYFNPNDTNATGILRSYGQAAYSWSSQPELSCSNGCKIPPTGSFVAPDYLGNAGAADLWQYIERPQCDSCQPTAPNVDLNWINPTTPNLAFAMPFVAA